MDTLFFILSKIIWAIISPENWIFILILVSLVHLYMGKYRHAKIFLSTATVLIFIIALLPAGKWMLYPLETHFTTNPTLPEKVDGIIVLSGAEAAERSHIWQQVELGGAAERTLYFMALARQYPDAKLIFTGGTGSLTKQEYKGADVAKKLFAEQGFDTNKIIFERESRNTYENVIYSKKMIQPKKNENWIVITTSWHMPRSVGLFCKAGWPVIPYPVDHETNKDNPFTISFSFLSNLSSLKTAIKEWVGLVAYYFSGKTTSILPKQCD